MTPEQAENRNIVENIGNTESVPKQLTTEQLREQVIKEILESYWVDLNDYTSDQRYTNILNLNQLEEQGSNEETVQSKAREVYKKYLELKLDTNDWMLEVTSLEALAWSIKSDRINDLKDMFEKQVWEQLEKYDFLDAQTINFIKLWMVNSIIKSPAAQITESLIWWFNRFFRDLNEEWVQALLQSELPSLNNSWRALWIEELLIKNIWDYFKKFDEIQEILNSHTPELSVEAKKGIISNIDWFRKPWLIEKWVDWLNITDEDLTKTTPNIEPLNKEQIKNYLINSREKINEIAKKMQLWDSSAEFIYSAINWWWVFWKWMEKLLSTLFKIPFLGKLLASILWLDPNNAMNELAENAKNYKYISSLKSLWKRKDKEWNDINWEKPFEYVDLSSINFNVVKNQINKIKWITWELEDDKYKDFWKQSFSENWYWEEGWIKLKFKLKQEDINDGKLSSSKLKDILESGLNGYEIGKQRIESEELREKREEEISQRQEEIEVQQNQLNNSMYQIETQKSEIDNYKSEIDNINSIIDGQYININRWTRNWPAKWLEDIKVSDYDNINWSNEFKNLIINTIWDLDLNWTQRTQILENDIKTVETLFVYIREYLNNNELSTDISIKDFLEENNDNFKEWLKQKTDSKLEEITELEISIEELEESNWLINSRISEQNSMNERDNFANQVWENISNISEETKLSDWIEIWEGITLKYENNILSIWEEQFKMSWSSVKIDDILISDNIVDFKWSSWIFSGEKGIDKSFFIVWIKELILNWKFTIGDVVIEKIEA